MGKVRHGSATTTHVARAAIQRSQALLATLSRGLGIDPKTVAKWRKRATVDPAPDAVSAAPMPAAERHLMTTGHRGSQAQATTLQAISDRLLPPGHRQVQTGEGKLCLFVGIGRTGKFPVTQLFDKADRRTAWEFLEHLLKNRALPHPHDPDRQSCPDPIHRMPGLDT